MVGDAAQFLVHQGVQVVEFPAVAEQTVGFIPNHERAGLFELLEAQARHDGAGVWASAP